jgi:hypothetical protein
MARARKLQDLTEIGHLLSSFCNANGPHSSNCKFSCKRSLTIDDVLQFRQQHILGRSRVDATKWIGEHARTCREVHGGGFTVTFEGGKRVRLCRASYCALLGICSRRLSTAISTHGYLAQLPRKPKERSQMYEAAFMCMDAWFDEQAVNIGAQRKLMHHISWVQLANECTSMLAGILDKDEDEEDDVKEDNTIEDPDGFPVFTDDLIKKVFQDRFRSTVDIPAAVRSVTGCSVAFVCFTDCVDSNLHDACCAL